MPFMNRLAPFDVVEVRSTAKLLITIEFKMVVRIDESGKRECTVKCNRWITRGGAGHNFPYPLPLCDHVAKARSAKNFQVAQNHHCFTKRIPNTKGHPLCFS